MWSRVSASAKCRNDPFLRDEVTMEWECLALLCVVVDGVHNPGRGGFFLKSFKNAFFYPCSDMDVGTVLVHTFYNPVCLITHVHTRVLVIGSRGYFFHKRIAL